MATPSAFAVIDIGSTKTVTVVGDTSDSGLLRVLGVGTTRSEGIEKGQISHIAKAVEAIQVSVEQAERMSGTRIVSASVGIAGTHLASLNNRGIVAIPDPSQPITAADVQRVIDAARMVSLKSNRQMLHALPRYFVVDGQDRVADPVGMHGQRLDVEMHIVTCGVNPLQNAIKCVEEAGLHVDSVIANPVAIADVLIRPEEISEGVALVDIGGGTTDVAVFLDGALIHTSSLPVGGTNITRDVVVGLRCPQDVAEEVKLAHAQALPTERATEAIISLDAFGYEKERSVSQRLLGKIVQARVEEILSMVMVEVKRAGQTDLISAGLVITGGTAELEGITELAERLSGMPARLGRIEEVYGLTDDVSAPAYAAALGLLRWASKDQAMATGPVSLRMPPTAGLGDLLKRIGRLGRIFLPQ